LLAAASILFKPRSVKTEAAPKVVAKISPASRVAHRLVVHDLDGDGRPELTWGSGDGTLVVWKPGL